MITKSETLSHRTNSINDIDDRIVNSNSLSRGKNFCYKFLILFINDIIKSTDTGLSVG